MSSTPRRTDRTTAARGRGQGGRGRGGRGWCPRDDHVYSFGNGVCPKCGTSLVPMDPLPSAEHLEVIEHGPVEREPLKIPTVRSPLVARVGVIGLVLAAFLVGLLFPRGKEPPPTQDTASEDRVSQSVSIGTVVRTASGSLVLSRLTQDGREFSATISVPAGSIDPSLVVGATVEVETAGSGARTIAGVSDVQLTHHLGGFSILGKLPSGMGKIVELRVASLRLRVPATPTWEVDLSGVWPVDGPEPRVRHIGSSRAAGDEAILRLVAILAWDDRIEVDFDLSRVETLATASVDGIEMVMSGEGDGLQDSWRTTLAASQQEQISALEIRARFEGIPDTVRTVTVRATRVSHVLWGPWSWRIA